MGITNKEKYFVFNISSFLLKEQIGVIPKVQIPIQIYVKIIQFCTYRGTMLKLIANLWGKDCRPKQNGNTLVVLVKKIVFFLGEINGNQTNNFEQTRGPEHSHKELIDFTPIGNRNFMLYIHSPQIYILHTPSSRVSVSIIEYRSIILELS